MKPATSKQTPNGGGKAMKVNYATGSGSRPKGGKTTLMSSAPSQKQRLRGG